MLAVQSFPEVRPAIIFFVPHKLLQVPVRFAYSHFDKWFNSPNLLFPAPSAR